MKRLMLSLISALVVLAGFTSCALLAPKASPADAQLVLAKAAHFRPAKRTLGPSKENRIALKKGQWVATLIRSKKDAHDITLQIFKVAEASKGAVSIETEVYSATNAGRRLVMQQRIRNYPTQAKVVYRPAEAEAAFTKLQVESLKVMDEDGAVQVAPQLGLPWGRIGSEILRSNVAVGEIKSEACRGTVLSASRCYLVPFTFKVLWLSESGITFAHSDIPIIGMLRSSGEETETEVIGYGSSGAEILIR